MVKYRFRSHQIIRNCEKSYKDYRAYKPFLQSDFFNRCAYCNLRDDKITTFFEVDHFVPKAAFKEDTRFKYLENDYKNLLYVCRKCNNAKSNKFEGDLSVNPYGNSRFHNPVDIDYNNIFYRNEEGSILSEDDKGIGMINDLKLYHPIHNLNWICERLELLCERLDKALTLEPNDTERHKLLKEAHYEALKYKDKCYSIFISNYNNSNFSI